MDDEEYIKKIGTMTEPELFDEVMGNPWYMTEPHYRRIRDAIYYRYDSLVRARTLAKGPKGNSPGRIGDRLRFLSWWIFR